MGAYQNNEQRTGTTKKTRGSVRNGSRLDAFTNGRKEGSADWGGCDSQLLQAVVVAISAMGGAVTFGLSRDGGAHSLTLLLDDSRATLWYNGNADLNECLQEAVARLEAMD